MTVNIQELRADLVKLDAPVYEGKAVHDWRAVMRIVNTLGEVLDELEALRDAQRLA